MGTRTILLRGLLGHGLATLAFCSAPSTRGFGINLQSLQERSLFALPNWMRRPHLHLEDSISFVYYCSSKHSLAFEVTSMNSGVRLWDPDLQNFGPKNPRICDLCVWRQNHLWECRGCSFWPVSPAVCISLHWVVAVNKFEALTALLGHSLATLNEPNRVCWAPLYFDTWLRNQSPKLAREITFCAAKLNAKTTLSSWRFNFICFLLFIQPRPLIRSYINELRGKSLGPRPPKLWSKKTRYMWPLRVEAEPPMRMQGVQLLACQPCCLHIFALSCSRKQVWSTDGVAWSQPRYPQWTW